MIKVLILDADTGQALEVTYKLRKCLGRLVKIIVAGQDNIPLGKNLAFFSKYADYKLLYPDPLHHTDAFIKWIYSTCEKIGIDYIIPIVEKTMYPLSKIKKQIKNVFGAIIPIPEPNQLELTMFKDELIILANKLGIPVPKTYILSSLDELSRVAKEVKFPAVIKLRYELGVPPPRYAIVYSKDDLLRKYVLLHKKQPYPIIQEYVQGFGIGSFFLFNKFSELILVYGHRRILEIPVSGGPSVIAETYIDIDALKYGFKLLKHLKWKGVAMVEFRYSTHKGMPVLMEVNPRFWGSLPLATDSNVNFPYELILYYEKRKRYRESSNTIRKVIMIKLLGTLFTLFTIRNLEEVKRYIKAIKYVLDNIPMVHIAELHDIKAELIYAVANVLHKIIS